MSDRTGIQWTDATWNPVSGCSKVSTGCKNCYAERDWARLSKNPKSPYFGRGFTDVKLHPERLDQPLRWRAPRRIFVNSMSDLFHEDVPDEFIDQVFAVMAMASARGHTFQVLTKRPERMRDYFLGAETGNNYKAFDINTRAMAIGACLGDYLFLHGPREFGEKLVNLSHGYPADADNWGAGQDDQMLLPLQNVWLGVSVENQVTADERIATLINTPAAIHFLSVEPLLEPIDLGPIHVKGEPQIQWVIVGGESGPDARPCHTDWIRKIIKQCKRSRVPVFVKQLGSDLSRLYSMKDLHGGNPAEWSEDLRIREFPR
ncbi:MAG: phage Gp37/Gp68 family protein [Candidatus Binatus sp.]